MKRAMVALAAAVLAAPPVAGQDEVLSKDLQAKSEAEAERQARRDLDALLQEFSGYNVGNRKLFQGDVWFWTDPRASDARGLCERDLLQIFYQPTNARSNNASEFSVQARGIGAERYYSFLEEPTSETLDRMYGDNPSSTDTTDRKCRSQRGEEWLGWFTAESPIAAVQGYLALLAARDALDAGLVTLDGCDSDQAEDIAKCRAWFDDAVKPEAISKIERNNWPEGQQVFRIDSGMNWITIEMKQPALQPTPENVKSLKVEAYIVIT
ncbi:hypothetical protein [Parerythrobacter lacustris]|uniref:Uncharacterized protein n=1 Tax=Parerythrobacter lacustris TaxID=2969984 RepID=A0ABT1XMZ3_9SPHN|nr:hypothetical protein [Parerythrobacter lacustris]MCR2832627.1 hypothetical protein [Parerythrobacter lacustris]